MSSKNRSGTELALSPNTRFPCRHRPFTAYGWHVRKAAPEPLSCRGFLRTVSIGGRLPAIGEVAIPRGLFRAILERIGRLRPPSVVFR